MYYGVNVGYPSAIQTREILVKGKCDAGLLLSQSQPWTNSIIDVKYTKQFIGVYNRHTDKNKTQWHSDNCFS